MDEAREVADGEGEGDHEALGDDGTAVAYELDTHLMWFIRSAERGVPRHHKMAYLFQRWVRAQKWGNTIEAAVLFAELSAMESPHLARRQPFNFDRLSKEMCAVVSVH